MNCADAQTGQYMI